MPAITVIALLNEGHKLDIYEKRSLANISIYPHLEKEEKESFMESLKLPDDILNDILIDDDNSEDIAKFKEILNG